MLFLGTGTYSFLVAEDWRVEAANGLVLEVGKRSAEDNAEGLTVNMGVGSKLDII